MRYTGLTRKAVLITINVTNKVVRSQDFIKCDYPDVPVSLNACFKLRFIFVKF